MIFEVFQLIARADNIPTGSYLIGDSGCREVAWVDPAVYHEDVVSYLLKHDLKVTALLVTHGHGDHTEGIPQAVENFGSPIYVHAADSHGLRGDIRQVSQCDIIPVGNLRIEVIETQGHTPGQVTYRIDPYLFVGDTLFAGSVGGAQGEDFERQRNALLDKVLALGQEAIVCPGHGPMSTTFVEKRYNPFLV